jgi:type III secretory pathway component EscU
LIITYYNCINLKIKNHGKSQDAKDIKKEPLLKKKRRKARQNSQKLSAFFED